MSREEVASPDGKWSIAFGVDSVSSSFVQIWHESEDNGAVVMIDNLGLTANEEHYELFPTMLFDKLEEIGCQFSQARKEGNPYPNITEELVIELAKTVGIRNIESKVYELWGVSELDYDDEYDDDEVMNDVIAWRDKELV